MMNQCDYHRTIQRLWEKAVKLYGKGQRGAAQYFDEEECANLASIGIQPQEVYDFAEDFSDGADPDLATFLLVHDVRREYFFEEQRCQLSVEVLDPKALPAREETAMGIAWLPRILAKAKAKLRGELDPSIMYGCGGDRSFLRQHDIHMAEFLRAVWRRESDDRALFEWVASRSKGRSASQK